MCELPHAAMFLAEATLLGRRQSVRRPRAGVATTAWISLQRRILFDLNPTELGWLPASAAERGKLETLGAFRVDGLRC